MNVQDAFYHGIRQSIRMVLDKMGPERVDKGLTAFEDGSHDWSNCFFARAFKDELSLTRGDPETRICEAIGLYTTRSGKQFPNKVPVRIIWHTFDGHSNLITAAEMKQFITDVRDESRPDQVMQLLRSLDYTGVEEKEIPNVYACRAE